MPSPGDALPAARVHLLKVPQPHKNTTGTWAQAFKHMNLWGTLSFKPPKVCKKGKTRRKKNKVRMGKLSMMPKMYWHTGLIPAFGRWRQEDLCEFEGGLVYTMNSRPFKATEHNNKKVPGL